MMKRYDPGLQEIGTGEHFPTMDEVAEGLYVDYDDHAHAIAEKDREIGRLKQELSHWTFERYRQLEADLDRVMGLLEELTAQVRGECPSLLNEDSGGDARLSYAIDSALQAWRERKVKE